MNGTEMNLFEANFLYSRKKLKESLKQALESKSYLFPVFGPFSIIMTIIYLPFGIISLPFNLFWFMKLKKLGLEKTYNFLAALNVWSGAKTLTWSIISLLLATAIVVHYLNAAKINFDRSTVSYIIFFGQTLIAFLIYLQAHYIFKKYYANNL
jgi:hypothetical protein